MRPLVRYQVIVAVLCGACGGSSTPAGTGAAAGSPGSGGQGAEAGAPVDGSVEAASDSEVDAPPAVGCVDIRVDETLLGEPGRWRRPFRTTGDLFWRDDQAVHVAWVVIEAVADGEVPRLVVSSFDPTTGGLLAQATYDVFPGMLEDLYPSLYLSAAGAPDGSFAVAYSYRFIREALGVERVLVGDVRDDSKQVFWDSPWPEELGGILHIGWDGEAFAIHGYKEMDSSGIPLVLVRLAPDGTVLLPETRVGGISGLREGSCDFQTDPVTGVSWATGEIGVGKVLLTGHYRDGTPLPGTEQDGIAVIEPQGVQGHNATFPAVAAGIEGALLAWKDGYAGTYVQRVGPDLLPSGNTIVIPYDQLTPMSPRYLSKRKTAVRWADHWWLAMVNDKTIDAYELTDTELLERRTLVSHSPALCAENDTCTSEMLFRAETLSAVTWNDELWFGFWDMSYETVYRIVRVEPGCVYKSMYDIALGL